MAIAPDRNRSRKHIGRAHLRSNQWIRFGAADWCQPADGVAHWTGRSMVKAVGISLGSVQLY
jgi:hypothetical protein